MEREQQKNYKLNQDKLTKMTRADYEEKITYYKSAVKNLKEEKGIE